MPKLAEVLKVIKINKHNNKTESENLEKLKMYVIEKYEVNKVSDKNDATG